MFVEWMMFNASDSSVTSAVLVLANVTCPFLATPLWVFGWGNVLIPFLNAALYGFVTWLVLRLHRKYRRQAAELQQYGSYDIRRLLDSLWLCLRRRVRSDHS